MARKGQSIQAGDVLLTIHEFIARSPDELSLAKGDRIELIERDDDFGDGWYLGRHLQTGLTGLFPEVYTTIAPKPTNQVVPGPQVHATISAAAAPLAAPNDRAEDSGARTPPAQVETASSQRPVDIPGPVSPITPATADYASPFDRRIPEPSKLAQMQPVQSNLSNVTAANRSTSQDSAVMNETLSVIDEHITDLRKPNPAFAMQERRHSNDSGSQYEMSSYIAGEETDEEESSSLTKQEVSRWSPAKASQYLAEMGVEQKHCDVFQEQEFSGEVLLELEQSSIFLKELDLGPIGRRLKTWQKIKALQDAVKRPQPTRKTAVSRKPISVASEDTSRQSTPHVGPNLPRIPQYAESMSTEPFDWPESGYAPQTTAGRAEADAPTSPLAQSPRPSAASVRSLGHSRRHSSMDRSLRVTPDPNHEKQASLDRNWTMGASSVAANGMPRPSPAAHSYSFSSDAGQTARSPREIVGDHDKGYSSGGELESKRQRNVLRKRDPSEHSRGSSHASDRRMSANIFRRSPHPPSPSVMNDKNATTQKQGGVRVVSEPFTGHTSPTVTRLEYDDSNQASRSTSITDQNDASSRKGPRAVSDAITGREKALVTLPVEKASPVEAVITESPTQTESSTPSGANRSMEYETSPHADFAAGIRSIATMASTRRKPKKATSAYQRGLEKKTPQEQLIGSDYSGWMKKRSSNVMTTWKPRFFVLKGRRLSYYYSEEDTEEKGLIDISNHRVLPATNDILTNVLASVTGANSPTSPRKRSSTNPNSPAGAGDENTPTSATTEPSSGTISKYIPSLSPQSSTKVRSKSLTSSPLSDVETFIFKLVPPRSGLSKAVNFTKPMVHYFAVSSKQEGRRWMAALMKATIDRDESARVVTTYQQKTISLEKARARRERPPALMDVDEEDDQSTITGSEAKSDDKSNISEPQPSQDSTLVAPEEAGAGLSKMVSDLEEMDKGRSPQIDTSASKRWSRRSSAGKEKGPGGRGLGININFTGGGAREPNDSMSEST